MNAVKSEKKAILSKERAQKICAELLGSVWKTLSDEDFILEPIRSGTSNYLYICSIALHIPLEENEPRSVLIRIYGKMLSSSAHSVVKDNVVFTLISERELGPKLYGVFPGGRIEEYIQPSRVLTRKELQEPRFLKQNAKILAACHQLQMPISKTPNFLFILMDQWLQQLTELRPSYESSNQKLVDFIAACELEKELQFLKNLFINNPNFPVVFCHNDFQENNILLINDSHTFDNDQLHLIPIDYEYSSYNYRCFDIGNHFNEFMFDNVVEVEPYFAIFRNDYPSNETQMNFCRTYLQCMSSSTYVESSEVDALINEIAYGSTLSHFLWTMWSCLQCLISETEFDYLKYGLVRLQLYRDFKSNLPHFLNGKKNDKF